MKILTTAFKALSDRNRLRVMFALMKSKELCACQIIELLQVTGATASRHLSVLVSAGLIESRKDGRWMYYRVCQKQGDFKVLIKWIESQLNNSQEAMADAKILEKIIHKKPEELCRKQRGEKCCPKK